MYPSRPDKVGTRETKKRVLDKCKIFKVYFERY